MAEEKTFDDLVKELDELEVKVKSGESTFEDAKKQALEIIIAQEVASGNLPIPPLPGLPGALLAFKDMVEEFLGKEVLSKIDDAAKIAAISAMSAKLMQFIMINASIFTGGLIPAPPNLSVVLRYFQFLESLSAQDEQTESIEATSDTSSAGNLV